MLDDQDALFILMWLCVVAGFLLSLSYPRQNIIVRKVREDEMEPYLAKQKQSFDESRK